jgi:hypothetical protein
MAGKSPFLGWLSRRDFMLDHRRACLYDLRMTVQQFASLGGIARAKKLGKARMSDIGKVAARARWSNAAKSKADCKQALAVPTVPV